jgi:hypothetical protein
MSEKRGKKTAGAFDVRSIIGALLGIYGVILTVMGLLGDVGPASPDAPSGAGDDINANLWAGLALLAVSAVFLAWWRLRPIVVPKDVDSDHGLDQPPG